MGTKKITKRRAMEMAEKTLQARYGLIKQSFGEMTTRARNVLLLAGLFTREALQEYVEANGPLAANVRLCGKNTDREISEAAKRMEDANGKVANRGTAGKPVDSQREASGKLYVAIGIDRAEELQYWMHLTNVFSPGMYAEYLIEGRFRSISDALKVAASYAETAGKRIDITDTLQALCDANNSLVNRLISMEDRAKKYRQQVAGYKAGKTTAAKKQSGE